MAEDPLLSIGIPGDSAGRLAALEVDAVLQRWAAVWGPRVTEAVRGGAPVGEGENAGRLRDSIHDPAIETGAGSLTLTWTTDVDYAPYVIEGTAPHPIYPRNARALHFDDVFALHVNHPGTKPEPFPERAIDRLLPEMTVSLAAFFEEM